MQERGTRGVLAIAAIVAAAGGISLRIARWWSNQSLWLDEAMIAVNVRDNGYLGLAGDLRFSQSAPLGWLLSQRVVVQALGTDERVLRLLPLLFSIATVVVALLIARRWLGPVGRLILVTSIAVAPMLVRYASEVKQYSADAFWSLALVGLAAWTAERAREPRRLAFRGWALWWLVAIVASWLSMAAVFLLPGLALILLVTMWRAHGRRAAVFGIQAGAIWLASFAVHYFAALRFSTSAPYLKEYWRDFGGLPRSFGLSDIARWLVRLPGSLAEDPLGITGTAAVIGFWLLVLAGLIVAARRGGVYGWLLGAPILTGVVLALAQTVPLTLRLALWLVPLLLVAVAIAVDAGSVYVAQHWRDSESRARALAATVALTVALAGFGFTVTRQASATARVPEIPFGADDRAAVQWLKQRHRPGDLTLVTISSYPSIAWYDLAQDLAPGWYVRGVVPGPDCDPQRAEREVAGYQRLIVYSGIQVDTHLMIEAKLGELGRVVDRQTFGLGMLWVVEVSSRPLPPLAGRQEPNNCLVFSEF